MPESFLEDLTMFKVVPDTNVPGFRVGLPDDNNESARRSLPAVPSGVAPGYDPYSNVLQAMVPTVVRPAGLFYQGNSGLFPTPYQAYVPVSGDSLSQDPLRQAVDRSTNPYANSGGSPFPDPLRQAVDRAANPSADNGKNPDPSVNTAPGTGNPYDDPGPPIGGLTLGALGALLGSPNPALGFLLSQGGYRLGNAMQRLHHRGMLDMGNAPSLGVNPVGP
jgi:hypothetical protein